MSDRAITVRADWDDEASVWSIHSDDVPGLHIEADAIEQIEGKVSVALADLAEFDPEVAALNGAALAIVTHKQMHIAVA